MNIQNQTEEILKDNPCMPRNELLRKYLTAYTNYTASEIDLFVMMYDDILPDNILRYARKLRQKLKIRDKVRQQLAEQEKRYYPSLPNLEPNPPLPEEKIIREPLTLPL